MKFRYAAVVFLVLVVFGLQFDGHQRLESEMAGKSQKKSDEPKTETFKVGGAQALITKSGDREVLQIDGRVEPYIQTKDGYWLKRDVFQKPAKSLRAAAERYLKSEVAK
jgi:hypothetical protein